MPSAATGFNRLGRGLARSFALVVMLVLVPAASTAPQARGLRPAATTTLQLTGTGVRQDLAVDVSANAVPQPGTADPCDVSNARDQGKSCFYTVTQGENVTLTPVPATGFAGWSVFECEGTGPCVVNMDSDRSVVATWTPTTLGIVPAFGPAPTQEEKITSSDGQISCSSTGAGACSADFDALSVVPVTLTASPASEFDSWSGFTTGDPGQHSACLEAGTSPTCTLFLSGNDVVGAKFKDATEDPEVVPPRQKVRLRVLVDAKSRGRVTSSRSRLSEQITCGSICSARFEQGETPTLTAQPLAGSRFIGWRGGRPYCSSNPTCHYPAYRVTSIKAVFTPPPPPPPDKTLTLTKAGRGTGTVTSSPAGISCGSTCAHAFKHGTAVTLTAFASARSRFAGWSGACLGTGTCSLTMSANRSVTATFKVLCVIPKVKGKKVRAAKRAIRKAHCSVGKVTKAFSAKVKKGRVISQKPKPGKKLAAGSKVKLKVSKGKKT
jgi:PASTA domain-containing protein/List-Bact-rpt repeat protein